MITRTQSKKIKLSFLVFGILTALFFVTTKVQSADCLPYADVRAPGGTAFSGGGSVGTSVAVKNFSATCSYRINLAIYKVFVLYPNPQYLTSQQLSDSDWINLAPGQEATLSVGTPGCAHQIDLFAGSFIPGSNPNFDGQTYPSLSILDWEVNDTVGPLCGGPAYLKVIKTVVNDNGGTARASDFNLRVDSTPVVSGATNEFPVGTHIVSETELPGYSADALGWGGDCSGNGTVTLVAGETQTCTITNNDDGAAFVNLIGRKSGVGSYTEGPIVLPDISSAVDLKWTAGGMASCRSSATPTNTAWADGTPRAVTGGTVTGIGNNTTNRTYTITCTKTGGGTLTDSVAVSVPTTGLYCSPLIQNAGVSVPVQTITASGGTTYSWNTGVDGSSCEASASCTPQYTTAGTKTVSVTSGSENAACTVVVKGSVKVISNQPTTWKITRRGAPLEQTEPSRGTTYPNQFPSLYSITQVPVLDGFTGPVIEPAGASLTIPQTGEDITFTITYTPIGQPPGGGDDKDLDLRAGEVNGTLSDGETRVLNGANALLVWTSNDVEPGSCVASKGIPSWVGAKSDEGKEQSGPITFSEMKTYTITCAKSGSNKDASSGTISDSVQIGARPPQCSDEKFWTDIGQPARADNDKDGTVDANDPGCISKLVNGAYTYDPTDDDESDQKPAECDINPGDPRCTPEPVKEFTQCNNGLDDDGDTKVDYKSVTPLGKMSDPGCSSETDPSELDDPAIQEI